MLILLVLGISGVFFLALVEYADKVKFLTRRCKPARGLLLPKKGDSSRPILRSVKHAYHVKSIFPDLINNDPRDGISLPAFRYGQSLENVLARAERRRSRVSIARRWPEFSQRDNSRYSADHLRPPESSERASGPALFLTDEAFHARDNRFVLRTFAAIDLAGFDLATEPMVVTRQTPDRLMHQRFAVASLPRGNAVKLSPQFW